MPCVVKFALALCEFFQCARTAPVLPELLSAVKIAIHRADSFCWKGMQTLASLLHQRGQVRFQ